MQVKHRFNTPTMDVTLKITGVFPLPGCEYALRSASGKLTPGKQADAGPILWVFRIPYADFPYSLVEVKGKSVRNMLCRDAVTMQALKPQTLAVTAVRSNLNSDITHPEAGRPGGKRLLTNPIFMVGLVAAILFVNVLVWLWLWPSGSDDKPADSGPEMAADSAAATANQPANPTPQAPKYTYLFIPVETLRDFKYRNYDHPSSQAFPPGTDQCYDRTTKLTIIRIPEVKGQSIKPELGIYLEGAMEEKCGLIELNRVNMPEYEEFVNYLTSDQDRFLVRPSAPNKQPSTELVESINTMNLETLQYVPLDTTPPTESKTATTSPQLNKSTKPAKKAKPAKPAKSVRKPHNSDVTKGGQELKEKQPLKQDIIEPPSAPTEAGKITPRFSQL